MTSLPQSTDTVLTKAPRTFRTWAKSLIILTVIVCVYGCEPQKTPDQQDGIDINAALRGDDVAGFKHAKEQRAFFFPKDHGPHPDFRQEWWYFTGNLRSDDGREFGFQVTFFRSGLTAKPPKRQSAWAAQQVFMAHFAVTDVKNKKFYASERFSRAAIGLAGAKLFPFRVWVEDWQLAAEEENDWPWRLRMHQKDASLSLTLSQLKRVVLQGDKGLSRKSSQGDASYYYSIPRLEASGLLTIGNERLEVTGQAWLDREWSTSALSAEQTGWDWFALQLKDNTEIMYYQIRRKDGRVDPLSYGTFINYNGESRTLDPGDVELEVTQYWQSPETGVRYPNQWSLKIKSLSKNFDIVPLIPNQELNVSARYWEGAVKVLEDTREAGRGYVELFGYEK